MFSHVIAMIIVCHEQYKLVVCVVKVTVMFLSCVAIVMAQS